MHSLNIIHLEKDNCSQKSYKCSTAATTLETSLNFKQFWLLISRQRIHAAHQHRSCASTRFLRDFFFLLTLLVFLHIRKSNYTYSPKGKLLYLPTRLSFPTLLYRLLKIIAVARSLTPLYPTCSVSMILHSQYSQN